MAIGKNGQNIKLASEVTGYKIDAGKESEYNSAESGKKDISEIEGLSAKFIAILNKAGIKTCDDFLDSERSTLLELNGIGEKTLEKLTKLVIDTNQE